MIHHSGKMIVEQSSIITRHEVGTRDHSLHHGCRHVHGTTIISL